MVLQHEIACFQSHCLDCRKIQFDLTIILKHTFHAGYFHSLPRQRQQGSRALQEGYGKCEFLEVDGAWLVQGISNQLGLLNKESMVG